MTTTKDVKNLGFSRVRIRVKNKAQKFRILI